MRTVAEIRELFEVERAKAKIDPDWKLLFSPRMRTTLGLCRYGAREIVLNVNYAKAAPLETVVDTIRHELAHAMAGPRAGHGSDWLRACAWLGCSGQRCKGFEQSSHGFKGWEAVCPGCSRVVGRMARKPKRIYRHKACNAHVEWRKI